MQRLEDLYKFKGSLVNELYASQGYTTLSRKTEKRKKTLKAKPNQNHHHQLCPENSAGQWGLCLNTLV